jgi:hypothetical protein
MVRGMKGTRIMNAYASQAQPRLPARPCRTAGKPASPNAAPDVRRYALRALPDTPRTCRAMTRLDARLWGIADPGDLETITGELIANAGAP